MQKAQASPGGALRVGMIGLGSMGMPMARNLLTAGVASRVSVFGRSPEKLAPALAAGAERCDTPRTLAGQSDVIITVLPDLPQLEALIDGNDGLLAGLAGPLLLVICSTSSPEGVRALAERLDERSRGQIHVLDAPLSGGTDGAEAGTLSIMVGGLDEDLDRARFALETMGTPVLLGPLGAGEVAKACNQMVVAATMVALSEATTIAERAGLDVEKLLTCLGGGYAGGRFLESRKQRLIDKDYAPSGIARYMIKDLGFAHEEAAQQQVVTPQLSTLLSLYQDLGVRGLGELDLTVTQRYIAELDQKSDRDRHD
ncbi:NAD(P)-dependent oxidoreductase [Kushneria sp. EE4]